MRTPRLWTPIAALALVAAAWVAAPIGKAANVPAPVAIPAATDPQPAAASQAAVALPNREGTLKFGVLGDFGTGKREQYDLGEQMAKVHERFPYELVITVGDNLYGSRAAQDFQKKFELPYKPLLEAGVKFYASLGNHDSASSSATTSCSTWTASCITRSKRRSRTSGSSRSRAPTRRRISCPWLEKELENSGEDWKIPYFHHPLYSSGERHGSIYEFARGLGAAVRQIRRQRRVHRARSLLRAHQAAAGHRLLRHWIGRAAAEGQHRHADGADGRRLRHRPRVPRRRDRRRRALLQRRSRAPAPWSIRASSSGGSRSSALLLVFLSVLVLFLVLLPRPSPRWRPGPSRSRTPTATFFAIRESVMIDADLAPAVQLQLAQALAADERRGAVADDRPDVQPEVS